MSALERTLLVVGALAAIAILGIANAVPTRTGTSAPATPRPAATSTSAPATSRFAATSTPGPAGKPQVGTPAWSATITARERARQQSEAIRDLEQWRQDEIQRRSRESFERSRP